MSIYGKEAGATERAAAEQDSRGVALCNINISILLVGWLDFFLDLESPHLEGHIYIMNLSHTTQSACFGTILSIFLKRQLLSLYIISYHFTSHQPSWSFCN